jgi:hypothetical protein
MLSGVVVSVTRPSTLTSSATASLSSTTIPLSIPSPGTCAWILDSDASFHMTPHSAHLSSLCSSHHPTVHIVDLSLSLM